MPTFDFAGFFHVGIRVPDIHAAMEELGASMGLTWATVELRTDPAWMPGRGSRVYELYYTYSCEGPVHLELVQGEPGSIWNGDDRSGAHHFGIWVDDVAAITAEMIAAGGVIEAASKSPDEGYGRFSYVRTAQGLLIEPVAVELKPFFERWWAGGSRR